MAIKSMLEKISALFTKYKFAILILVLGLSFMIIPKSRKENTAEYTVQTSSPEIIFEEKLASMLSRMDGAGEVQVILTQLEGEQTLYQTNDSCSKEGSGINERTETVTVTDSNRNETGLVKQIVPAVYKGAIILCQGADDPSVKYNIINAVSKLIGIGSNCISVLKMK